jgi:hypothetical protein
MARRTLTVVAALAATLVLAATAPARTTSTPTLTATVGPGYTIDVSMNGKKVKTLKTGTYKLVVHDKGSIHGFSLDGPHGYAKDFTAVPFVGTKTFTLKLKAGAYKAYCPAHESMMFQHFSAKA